jgi:phosphoglycolate phosphatase
MWAETEPDLVRSVIFDLDGTLTDPFTGITGCLRHTLQALGADVPAAEDLASYIGPPIRGTFATLLGTSDSGLIEKAVAHYRSRYRETGLFENELYQGIPDLLSELTHRGLDLYIATSKLRTLALRIAAHFEIASYFRGIYGAEEGGAFDDKRELLPHLIQLEGLSPSASAMVGDRRFDVEAGKVSQCATVGVSYGYGSVEELTLAGADFICRTPSEIAALPIFRPAPPVQGASQLLP